jgi:hypothetical protein
MVKLDKESIYKLCNRYISVIQLIRNENIGLSYKYASLTNSNSSKLISFNYIHSIAK